MGQPETSRGSCMSRPRKLFLGLLILGTCVVLVVVVPVLFVNSKNKNDNNQNTGEINLARLLRVVRDGSSRRNVLLSAEDADDEQRAPTTEQSLRRTTTTRTTDVISSSSSLAPTTFALDDDTLINLTDAALSDFPDSTSSPSIFPSNTYNATNDTFSATANIVVSRPIMTDAPTDAPTTTPTNAPTPLPTPPPTPITRPLPTTAAPSLPRVVQRVNSYTILETIPHDNNAFTQGLTFDPEDSSLVYESTGLYGQSDVRKVNIQTGQALLERASPAEIFGEGLAYYTTTNSNDGSEEGRLIHITWKSRRGFIFAADTLDVLQEFQFSTTYNEGWGITYHATRDQFFVTDGSSNLHVWDRDLNEVQRIPVRARYDSANSSPISISRLNEIEWDAATDTILANVWQQDIIVRIDPTTGEVITEYNLADLVQIQPPGANVLNGIAISGGDTPDSQDLWITGKLWPNMYRIEFNE